MNSYKKYFIKTIKENFPETFDKIISDTDKNYIQISIHTNFASASKNPLDKRLDFCAYFLALIKTLDNQGERFEEIKRICLEITTEHVRPRNKFQEFMKRLLPNLLKTWFASQLLKRLNKKVSRNENKDGFRANIITEKQETYGLGFGIDILECGICKLFNKHNLDKYASILCAVDELTSKFAGLQLIRTGTIANGANKCDFRFKQRNDKND